MKIFYTKQFKEILKKPNKRIELGDFKIRDGEGTQIDSLTSENICDGPFSDSASPTRDFYRSQFVRYEDRFQIFLDIFGGGRVDQTMYDFSEDNESFYQVLLFYYKDLTIQNGVFDNNNKLAFILFENQTIVDGKVKFRGLRLTSTRNIITTPPINYLCEISFNQSDFTKFLEGSWGQDDTKIGAIGKENTSELEYVSLDSWKNFWVEEIASEGNLEWMQTVYMNNFGLKIY